MIIYKITNNINNKVYIGQTTGTLKKRWQRHNWNCTKNISKMAITSAIIKYGKDSFTIESIYECVDIEDLNTQEEHFIEKHNSLSPNGYNLTRGGNNRIMTEETKRKISKGNMGKKRTKEAIKNLSEAHKGWIPSEETREKLRKHFSGKPVHENTRKGAREKLPKTYTMIDPGGNEITFRNMKEFCKKNGLCNSKLCLVASGKRRTHKGWTRLSI